MTTPKFINEPIVACLAEMEMQAPGLATLRDWVNDRHPECGVDGSFMKLWPHDGYTDHSDNELLVELAGRKCYNSFGAKAGRKANAEYIAHTQSGDVPHRSILYHAKMTFFVAGISRRVTHELMRHYVGADRTEEGSPSQESTRYTEHTGHYVVHPTIAADEAELRAFRDASAANYAAYHGSVRRRMEAYEAEHGKRPVGMDRKRILESASSFLSHSVETSLIWTCNPISLAGMLRERLHEAADMEWRRLAEKWRALAVERWPNLFPQPWMQGCR